jgi:hypothetical protein
MFGYARLFSVRERENNRKGFEWREGSGSSALFYCLFTAQFSACNQNLRGDLMFSQL